MRVATASGRGFDAEFPAQQSIEVRGIHAPKPPIGKRGFRESTSEIVRNLRLRAGKAAGKSFYVGIALTNAMPPANNR